MQAIEAAPPRGRGADRWEFFWLLVRRDFKVRYAGSTLGAAWNLIHPIVMILIYMAIFSALMNRGDPGAPPFDYARQLCAGMLVWLVFAETLSRGVTSLVDNRAFLQKVAFPPLLLHASILFNVLVVYSVGTIALWLILFALGASPPLAALASIGLLALAGLAASGLAMILSAAHVFFRDTAQAVQIALQIGFWFNPIVYPKKFLTDLDEGWTRWLSLNPVEHFVSTAQSLFGASQAQPSRWAPLVIVLFPIVSVLAGRAIFRRLLPEVRDGL